jgi:hypothetical protein
MYKNFGNLQKELTIKKTITNYEITNYEGSLQNRKKVRRT